VISVVKRYREFVAYSEFPVDAPSLFRVEVTRLPQVYCHTPLLKDACNQNQDTHNREGWSNEFEMAKQILDLRMGLPRNAVLSIILMMALPQRSHLLPF